MPAGDDRSSRAGSRVTIRGLRCEEDPGSWYGWPTGNVGPMQELATDARGRVTLRYPIRFGSPLEWKKTTTICTAIAHTDYVFEDIEVTVDGSQPTDEEPAHVQLMKQGCHVSFTAKDTQDVSLAEFGVKMAGAGAAEKWRALRNTATARLRCYAAAFFWQAWNSRILEAI